MLVNSCSKLIGLSLGLYVSVASASPVDTTTQEITVLLEPRRVAEPNLCGGARWVRRECQPNISPQSWRDVCQVTIGNLPPIQTLAYSSCPLNTVCENIEDEDDDKTIKCVNIMKPGQSSNIVKPLDPQIEFSVLKQAIVSGVTNDLEDAITVQNDVSASVSAVILSKDSSFVITPKNVLEGKIHGSEVTVCRGYTYDAAKANECYPTGRFDLHRGDIIDFTWGMVSAQVGMLASTIWPTASSK